MLTIRELLQLLIVSKNNIDQGFGGEKWVLDVAIEASRLCNVLVITTDKGDRNVNYASKLLARPNVSIVELNNEQRKSLLAVRKLLPDKVDTVYFVDSPFNRCLTRKFISLFPDSYKIKGNHTPISVYGNEPEVNLLIRIYFRLIKPLFLSAYKDVNLQHVLNRSDLQVVKKRYICTMIPNGIAPPDKIDNVKYDKFTLVLLGRLNYQKGVDRLRKILSMINLDGQEFEILILGTGPYLKKLKKISHKSLKILGYVNETEKQNIVKSSHFLISLSRWEVFPYNILESLSMGTPVISFKIQGTVDMVADNYNGFLASDPKSMARSIERAYKIYKERAYLEMRDSALKSSERYYISKIIPDLMRMLRCNR